jgi:hypothetical protein
MDASSPSGVVPGTEEDPDEHGARRAGPHEGSTAPTRGVVNGMATEGRPRLAKVRPWLYPWRDAMPLRSHGVRSRWR